MTTCEPMSQDGVTSVKVLQPDLLPETGRWCDSNALPRTQVDVWEAKRQEFRPDADTSHDTVTREAFRDMDSSFLIQEETLGYSREVICSPPSTTSET